MAFVVAGAAVKRGVWVAGAGMGRMAAGAARSPVAVSRGSAAVGALPRSAVAAWPAGGPAARLGSVRRMGIMDNLQGRMSKRQEESKDKKRADLFKANVDFMMTLENYTMADHIVSLRDGAEAAGLRGWKSKLRSSEQQKELKNRFAELEVGEALTEQEIADPARIRRKEKIRIANEVGCGVDRVNQFMRSYETSVHTHKIIKSRKDRGLPLPSSEDEFKEMIMADGTGVNRRAAQKQMGRIRSMRAVIRR